MNLDPLIEKYKVTDHKFWRNIAYALATYGFYYLLTHDQMSEWYFVGYMATVGGVEALLILIKAIAARYAPLAPLAK